MDHKKVKRWSSAKGYSCAGTGSGSGSVTLGSWGGGASARHVRSCAASGLSKKGVWRRQTRTDLVTLRLAPEHCTSSSNGRRRHTARSCASRTRKNRMQSWYSCSIVFPLLEDDGSDAADGMYIAHEGESGLRRYRRVFVMRVTRRRLGRMGQYPGWRERWRGRYAIFFALLLTSENA
ncbi:hypothetical protein H4582DRAFT_1006152 [Lactarius indigo]|nr:hypothetical protein H4582DRAFT_1006152 [Lactarius indigo]